jgi:hypothetical protein
MSTLIRLILVFILFLWSSPIIGQQKIKYGSNNGKYISIFNKKIYYEEYGKGTPLILLQGGMGSIADFALCIPELSKHFRVIAPDTPGQGRSELADSMSYELMAEYISKLIDILNQRLKPRNVKERTLKAGIYVCICDQVQWAL